MISLAAIFGKHSPMERSGPKTSRFLLWVDGVGGFWVCLGDSVVLGLPGSGGEVDVPILADVSQRHARIRRDGEAYLIEAIREVRVDGRRVDRMALLTDGSTIQLGRGVRLRFRRPHVLSATARLEFLSRHRTQPPADAVLLMADTCVLGPDPRSHVVCRHWEDEVVLSSKGGELYCQSGRPFLTDGTGPVTRARITAHSTIQGDRFSLGLEELTPSGPP